MTPHGNHHGPILPGLKDSNPRLYDNVRPDEPEVCPHCGSTAHVVRPAGTPRPDEELQAMKARLDERRKSLGLDTINWRMLRILDEIAGDA